MVILFALQSTHNQCVWSYGKINVLHGPFLSSKTSVSC